MRTTFTARHFRATEPLKDFAENEVQRLQKYYDGSLECEILLDWEKQAKIAEIKLGVNGQLLTAVEKSENFRKSITLATDKLERQVKKYKGRWSHKGGEKIPVVDTNAPGAEVEDY